MEEQNYDINKDITGAYTLPGNFYSDPQVFDRCKRQIIARSWQFICDSEEIKTPGSVYPFRFSEGAIDEPLIFLRSGDDELHCMSNVCTHRGNILVDSPGNMPEIRCCYHGRKFGLDGKFRSMPETAGMKNFPSPSDDLPQVSFRNWNGLLFASLDATFPFEELISEIERRVGWLPMEEFKYAPSRSRDYLVHANWALYCDNYLEGFHIPFIHKGLSRELDYSGYSTELYRYSNLQLGVSRGGESVFDLPVDSPDHGQEIAAYYFWLFPNMMFNFYPWGLSVNVVRPLKPNLSKVSFLSYVWKPEKIDSGAGAALDRVEREDEAIVEKVQKGVSSRLYERGRFSPKMEQGVHHFHTLISEFLDQ